VKLVRSKTQKLVLDSYGSFLGMEKGCFSIRDKNGKIARCPLFENEIGEIVLKSGNAVSTGALASLGFWG
jgi:CRISPR/Cas system-associated endonuclease Cas1